MSFEQLQTTKFQAGEVYKFNGIVANPRKSRTTGEMIPPVRKFTYTDPTTNKQAKGIGVSLRTHEIIADMRIPRTVDLAFYRDAAKFVATLKLKSGSRLSAIGRCSVQQGDMINFIRFDCEDADWVSQPSGTDEL